MKDETLPEEMKEKLAGKVLNDVVLGHLPVQRLIPAGLPMWETSAGASQQNQFTMACTALGTPGHSWQYTAQSGMHIGHAGMIAAARTLVQAGLRLMTSPRSPG
jgi:aminobenzoyl-glutamate utilization protein B